MSIFFLVMALLVVAILLSRMTWWPALGERRSVKHHEHAMDVLRSMSSVRPGSETVNGLAARDPIIASNAASADAATVPDEIAPVDPSWQPQETVRLLGVGAQWSTLPDTAASPPPPPAVPKAPAAAAGTGKTADIGVTGEADGTETVKPSFVFFADDGGTEALGTNPPLPRPPSIDDVTEVSPSRYQALLLFVSRTMDRPRIGVAVGLATVVVMATVLGTVLGIMSSSSGRSQRVRQVTARPTTSAPAPVPAPTIPPVATDVPPPAALPVTTPATTTPTTSVPPPIRSTITTGPPPTSTTTPPTTSPPTTSTPASVVSSAPPTSAPRSTTSTTSRTSTTSTTSTTTTTKKP